MMKRFLILLFVLAELISYGQAKIGMSPVFSFSPNAAANPTVGVQFGDSVSLKVYVKNSGNISFNGIIKVQAKRDTVAGIICDTSSLVLSSPLNPNDSIPVVLTFTPSPGINAFKSGGNGNTIVVWPLIYSGTGIEGDSVRPVIWINGTNSVRELENNQFKIYPNPVVQSLIIKSKDNANYKNISIYDVFARKVKEVSFKEIIDVSELNSGSYWMIISSETKTYRIPFIKE